MQPARSSSSATFTRPSNAQNRYVAKFNRPVINDRTSHLGADTCESRLILVQHLHNCTLTKIVDSGIKVSYNYTSGEKSELYDQ